MDQEIKIGSRIRNNDPRAAGKIVVVMDIYGPNVNGETFAVYETPTKSPPGRMRQCGVNLNRIRTDDKKTSHGWSLVSEPVGGHRAVLAA